MIAVADSSALIAFDELGRGDLLRRLGAVKPEALGQVEGVLRILMRL